MPSFVEVVDHASSSYHVRVEVADQDPINFPYVVEGDDDEVAVDHASYADEDASLVVLVHRNRPQIGQVVVEEDHLDASYVEVEDHVGRQNAWVVTIVVEAFVVAVVVAYHHQVVVA